MLYFLRNFTINSKNNKQNIVSISASYYISIGSIFLLINSSLGSSLTESSLQCSVMGSLLESSVIGSSIGYSLIESSVGSWVLGSSKGSSVLFSGVLSNFLFFYFYENHTNCLRCRKLAEKVHTHRSLTLIRLDFLRVVFSERVNLTVPSLHRKMTKEKSKEDIKYYFFLL